MAAAAQNSGKVTMAEEDRRKAYGLAARDSSGVLSPFHFSRRENGEDDVTMKILYCGICHTDLHQAKNEWKSTAYPCLPGYLFYSIHNALQFCRHEIVGIVTEVGGNVGKFEVGDKAGVGYLVGSCHSYGGFSDKIVVDQHFIVKIPENLPMDRTAPLLCAGITVYSPMKNFELDEPGKHLGVIGLGGLGHVAVKFGKAFGMKVTVISSSG